MVVYNPNILASIDFDSLINNETVQVLKDIAAPVLKDTAPVLSSITRDDVVNTVSSIYDAYTNGSYQDKSFLENNATVLTELLSNDMQSDNFLSNIKNKFSSMISNI